MTIPPRQDGARVVSNAMRTCEAAEIVLDIVALPAMSPSLLPNRRPTGENEGGEIKLHTKRLTGKSGRCD